MSLVKVEEGNEINESSRDDKGRDYSIVILAKTFGSLLGIPFMTTIWAKSIPLGTAGMSLLFLAGAVSRVSSIDSVLTLAGCLRTC
jgi:hypothetical protein